MRKGSQQGQKKIWRAKQVGVRASAHVSNQRYDENVAKNCSNLLQIRRQWTVHCMRKPLLTGSARIMLIYKQLSRSVNYLAESCQQSSIQPIRPWYQKLVSWDSSINGMHTPSSPDHSRLVLFTLEYTWLSCPKPNWEPVRRPGLFLKCSEDLVKKNKYIRFYFTQIVHWNGKILFPWRKNCLSKFLGYNHSHYDELTTGETIRVNSIKSSRIDNIFQPTLHSPVNFHANRVET